MTGAVDWELARRIAHRVGGNDPLAQSYLYDSLAPDFESFTAKAEKLVAEETGLVSLAGPARARVIDRSQWVDANIKSFQRLLRPLTDKLEEKLRPGPTAGLTRKVAGAELGLVLGWMSKRVLGQYDLLLTEDEDPDDQDIVYYVGPNVLAIEKRYAFPPGEFRLWLALHELTHRAQFTGVPWMREHFLGLVKATLESADPDPERILAGVRKIISEKRQGRDPLEGGLALLFATDEQKAVLDRVSGLMSLLEGHGDVTMGRAGAGEVPGSERFHRVLHDRRNNRRGAARLLQKLMGMEAKLAQYALGEAFIEVVELDRGPEGLAVVWEAADHLPSMEEIRDPSLWLSRVRPPVPAD